MISDAIVIHDECGTIGRRFLDLGTLEGIGKSV